MGKRSYSEIESPKSEGFFAIANRTKRRCLRAAKSFFHQAVHIATADYLLPACAFLAAKHRSRLYGSNGVLTEPNTNDVPADADPLNIPITSNHGRLTSAIDPFTGINVDAVPSHTNTFDSPLSPNHRHVPNTDDPFTRVNVDAVHAEADSNIEPVSTEAASNILTDINGLLFPCHTTDTDTSLLPYPSLTSLPARPVDDGIDLEENTTFGDIDEEDESYESGYEENENLWDFDEADGSPEAKFKFEDREGIRYDVDDTNATYRETRFWQRHSLDPIAEESEEAFSESSSSVDSTVPQGPRRKSRIPRLSPSKIPKRISSLSVPTTPTDDARLEVSSDVIAQREARAQAERENAARNLFKPLPPKVQEIVSDAVLRGGGGFTAKSLRRVYPSYYGRTDAWLDDEAVNGYLELICRVANTAAGVEAGDIPAFHTFNSRFFDTYRSVDGQQKISRWFKRAKLQGATLRRVDTVFFPICKGGNHWVLLVLKPREQQISFYDSMAGTGTHYVTAMERILTVEMGNSFHKEQWLTEDRAVCPRQKNADDCGVYAATIAKFVSLGLDLEFSAEDIVQQRQIMVAELVKGHFVN